MPLSGEVRVSGAKNAALPILCAALLTSEPLTLTNVPRLNDVRTMQSLLAQMGVALDTRVAGTVSARCVAHRLAARPYELVKTMRASILALGPLLAALRRGARVAARRMRDRPAPGRPARARACRRWAPTIDLEHGYINATRAAAAGCTRFVFDVVTVTGTENLMMAATLAEGDDGARERRARAGGGRSRALSSPRWARASRARARDRDHDRGRGAAARARRTRSCPTASRPGRSSPRRPRPAATCRDHRHAARYADAVLDKLREAGADIAVDADVIRVRRSGRPQRGEPAHRAVSGFPTDMQAQFMALATRAEGTSVHHRDRSSRTG